MSGVGPARTRACLLFRFPSKHTRTFTYLARLRVRLPSKHTRTFTHNLAPAEPQVGHVAQHVARAVLRPGTAQVRAQAHEGRSGLCVMRVGVGVGVRGACVVGVGVLSAAWFGVGYGEVYAG